MPMPTSNTFRIFPLCEGLDIEKMGNNFYLTEVGAKGFLDAVHSYLNSPEAVEKVAKKLLSLEGGDIITGRDWRITCKHAKAILSALTEGE